MQPFLPKSDGVGFIVSDFIIETDGPLQHMKKRVRFILEIGKQNTDKICHLSNDKFMIQVQIAL